MRVGIVTDMYRNIPESAGFLCVSVMCGLLVWVAPTLAGPKVPLDSPQAQQQLTLQKCLGLVNEHSVQIAESIAVEAKAAAALDESRKPRLPQLVGQANFLQTSDLPSQAGDANKAVLRLEQGTLPFGTEWKLGSQRFLELQVARLGKVESARDVELLVKQLYFSILRDEEIQLKINDVADQLRSLSNAVLPQFQIDRSPTYDSVKIRSALFDIERQKDILDSQLTGERAQLAELIGLEIASSSLKPIVDLPNFDFAVDSKKDAEENPTIQSLAKSEEAANAAISVARAARLPTLSAAVEYGFGGQTFNKPLLLWSAGLQLRLSIFDWGLISSQIAQAKSERNLAEKKKEVEIQHTNSLMVETIAVARAHQADAKRLQSLLPSLKRAALATLIRYKRAAVGVIEVTDALDLWQQNLVNERMAFYAYLENLATIERLTGGKRKFSYE